MSVIVKSGVPGKVPTTSQLEYGQLALNYADQRIYFKNSSNQIVQYGVTVVPGSSGVGLRITGDFSNATIANRLMFQTSTLNGATLIRAIPNGTGTTASIQAGNSLDPNNQAAIAINATATECSINSQINGTGTYLPMTFTTGGLERLRIDTIGNVGIGTNSPALTPVTNRVYLTLRGTGTTAADGNGVLQFTSNAASVDGINLGNIEWNVSDNTSSTSTRVSYITSSASGTVANNRGSFLAFATKADGVSGAGTERMRITANGNLGINTSTPATTLDVNGSQITRGDASGYIMFAPKTGTEPFGVNYDRFEIRLDPSNPLTTIGNVHGGTGVARALSLVTGSAERVRIDTLGRVGIATLVPANTFQVGTGSSDTRAVFYSNNAFSIGIANSTGFAGWIGGSGATDVMIFSNSGGTERMRIDAAGIITKANLPAFQASSTGGTAIGSDVIFNTVQHNNGSHYNATNGRFTAPVTGRYQFHFNLMVQNTNPAGEYRFAFYVNGAANGGLRFIYQKPSAAGWYTMAGSSVIYLTAGQYVTVRFETGQTGATVYGDASYSSFSGTLLG